MAGETIRFAKAARERAKANGKALFAYGMEDRHLTRDQGAEIGLAHLWTPMEPVKARGLFWFTFKVHHGMTPEEAFDAVDWEEGRLKEQKGSVKV